MLHIVSTMFDYCFIDNVAICQCSSLLDSKSIDEYMDDIREDYEDVRQMHYESLRDRRYLSLEKARARRLTLNFINENAPGFFFNCFRLFFNKKKLT